METDNMKQMTQELLGGMEERMDASMKKLRWTPTNIINLFLLPFQLQASSC
jgi:hypothetical protein